MKTRRMSREFSDSDKGFGGEGGLRSRTLANSSPLLTSKEAGSASACVFRLASPILFLIFSSDTLLGFLGAQNLEVASCQIYPLIDVPAHLFQEIHLSFVSLLHLSLQFVKL